MNINEFKAEVVRNGMTLEEFSNKAGIARATLYRRFKEPNTFTLGEITGISETLDLTNERVMNIFFSGKVS